MDTQWDTQWPRWEVFKQDRPKKPHQAVGSVHATDAEHALFNARSVFARRPNAVSMWVAPESAIFEMTAEELEDPNWDKGEGRGEAPDRAPETYLVFAKLNHRQSLTYVDHLGEVEAKSPAGALKKAIATFTDNKDNKKTNKPALAWWLAPAEAVAKSRDEDAGSWFAPAKDKTYKQQSQYATMKAGHSRRPHEPAG
jgi:ring-1,2-phenylacetyl-CoA epoxidase subunit PaaB